MDRPDNSRGDLEGALRDIGVVNRLLGGRRIVLRAVEPFLEELRPGETLRVLDVGTGAGDLPIAIAEHARGHSRRVKITAVDRDPCTAAIAAGATTGYPEIRVVQADAFRLPFQPGAFDLVIASLFLHHFDHRQAVRLLRAFSRLGKRAVLINDLRRHLLPWSFIYLASRATRRHPMFVHDGPLSVLRGFTLPELSAIGKDAGAGVARVERRWPYRLLMTLQGGEAP